MHSRIVDLKQLALELGISPTTVSRVLSGQGSKYRIAKETQAKVLTAAKESGLTINFAARGLRLRVSHVIGLIVPDIANPFFAALALHIERAARIAGYSVLLANSQESVEDEADAVRVMQSRTVDGLIIAPVSGVGEHLEQFGRGGKALVLVDRAPTEATVSSVILDNFGAAREGVRVMAKAGHHAIACLRGAPASYADGERVRGYRQTLMDLGLPVREEWIAGGEYNTQSGCRGTLSFLRLKERPTAILALGNLLALGALEALQETKLRVPDDMSLLSFDEQPWAAFLSPPMTTINQPVQLMGERAVELVLAHMKNDIPHGQPRRTVLPFTIINRMSIRRK